MGFCRILELAHGIHPGLLQQLRQLGCLRATRRRQGTDEPTVDVPCKQFNYPGDVLIAQHAKHCQCAGTRAEVGQILREHCSCLRVVPHIEYQRRTSRQHLKTPGHSTLANPRHSRHGDGQALAQGLQGCQHPTRVLQLDRALQRRKRQAGYPPLRPPERPLVAFPVVAEFLPDTQQARTDSACACASPDAGGAGSASTAGFPVRKIPAFS